jgi:alpha-beta hydrolase superfamily lysophospholipase
VDVPVYVLHSLGDTLCQASASKHFQTIHTNPLSKFVYPEQGKHELLQEATMWKVATRVCVLLSLFTPSSLQDLLSAAVQWMDALPLHA